MYTFKNSSEVPPKHLNIWLYLCHFISFLSSDAITIEETLWNDIHPNANRFSVDGEMISNFFKVYIL